MNRSRLHHRPAAGLALSLLFAALAADAGGTATLEAGDGKDRSRMNLEFDGDRLRMTPEMDAKQGEHYVVFRDGRMYSVSVHDGQPMVLETSAMMKMMGSMVGQTRIETGLDDVAAYHGLNPTGRSETHAGISGEVYTLDYTTRAGKREQIEMVLAKNPALIELGTAMTAFSASMARAMGQPQDTTPGAQALADEFKRRQLGVLRVKDGFRLTRLDSATPKAARFVLPAEPTAMPAMPAGLFGAAAAGDGAAAGEVADKVDEKVERQKDRVRQRTENEADQATDRVVDKALNKAFDSLFGR